MNESEQLRTAVQDERARRTWAERELAEETKRAATWRQRAEDRADRIRLLEARLTVPVAPAPSLLRRVVRAIRKRSLMPVDLRESGSNDEQVAETPSVVVDASAPADDVVCLPAYPFIRVAVLGGSHLPFLTDFDTVFLRQSSDAMSDADLLFIALSSFEASDPDMQVTITEWVSLVGRQPLVVWADLTVSEDSGARFLLDSADLKLCPEGLDPAQGLPFSGGVDARRHNPIGRSLAQADRAENTELGRIWYRGMAPVIGVSSSLSPAYIELMSAGVPVITPVLGPTLAPLVGLTPGSDLDAIAELVAEDRDLLGQASLAAHRYAHRVHGVTVRSSEFLHRIGAEVKEAAKEVGALLISNKPAFVMAALESINRQRNVAVFPVIGLHGDPSEFGEIAAEIELRFGDLPHQVLEFGGEVTLGECLNRAAQACSSPILAKFDDDDWYGPHYLEDAVAALDYSQADLVGKGCYFVEIEETGDVYLVRGPEEDYTSHVIGSSMVFRRRLWEDVPFPHRPSRVDSIFLRGVRAADRRIYSTTRYEHGVRRRPDGHTWIVDPAHFAARGTRVGVSFENVVIDVDDRLASGDA